MSTNLFNKRTHLFDFFMDSKFKVKFNQQIPRLKEEFHQNVSESQLIEMGFNRKLDDGFNQRMANQTMITDYRQFRSIKWKRFLTYLQKSGSVNKEEPKFVFMSGIINVLFGSDNTIYGQMFRGVIYLYKSRSLRNKGKISRVIPEIYSYTKFKYSITERDVSHLNELEKHIRVDSIDFKDNKFIVCYVIKAIDSNDSPIEIECRRTQKINKMAKEDWIHCMTKNINTIVYGNRIRGENSKITFLRDIKVMTVQQMRDEYGRDWPQSDDQFSYFNDSLNYIKSCVKSESLVYEFEVKNEVISLKKSEPITPNIGFLPDFYTN